MGVLSLHNECPPNNYAVEEAREISEGLVIGEHATATMLRALSDCLRALAAMDDTVGNIVSAWSAITTETGEIDYEAAAVKAQEVEASYQQSFDELEDTVGRLSVSIQKYREHQAYGRSAHHAGRGLDYQTRYEAMGEGGFVEMIGRRIELLRKLKVRVKVLRHLRPTGLQLLKDNDYSEFFLVFMQPIRDVSVAVQATYDEVVRGALVSHAVMFQSCQLAGEELSDEEMEAYLKPVLVNGNGHPTA